MAQRKRRNPRAGSSARRAPVRPKARRVSARPKGRPATRPRARTSTPRGSSASAAAWDNAIGCVQTHLDYTTHSIEDMKAFYGGTLGFTQTTYDPRHEYLLVRTGPGASLGFMPPMPGPPEQWRPPREPAIYLYVADVDRAHRDLQARGVTFQQEPADMPWGHRVAILRDPEGRQVCLAQPIAR